jgi:hypothetical protein
MCEQGRMTLTLIVWLTKEQDMRRFYLFQRNKVFYVQFLDPVTKRRLTGKSTGKDTRDEALLVVHDWLEKGLPQKHCRVQKAKRSLPVELSTTQVLTELKKVELAEQDVVKIEKILKEKGLIDLIVRKSTPEAEPLLDYLQRFWDYERSPYVEEKLSHKVKIGKSHTELSLERVKRYWKPYFQGKILGEVSRQDIKDFSVFIAKDYSTLSPLTLKQILRVGVTALRWAFCKRTHPCRPYDRLARLLICFSQT